MRSISCTALAAVTLLTATSLAAQDRATPETRLQAAIAQLDATQPEAAIESLNQLLARLAAPDLADLRANALLYLGQALWTLGSVDSADAAFRAALVSDAFAEPDPERFHPDLQAALQRAADSVVVIALRVPADSVLGNPVTERLPVLLASGAGGQVSLALRAVDGGDERRVTLTMGRRAQHGLSVLADSNQVLEAGAYLLTATLLTANGQTDSTQVELDLTRLPVDTIAHPLPPGPSRLLPESERGGPKRSSLVRGIAIGVVAAAIPFVIGSGEFESGGLRSRALMVGLSIGIGGAVGVSLGRQPVPLPDNMAANERLRAEWRDGVQNATDENERRRQFAPVRIRVRQP